MIENKLIPQEAYNIGDIVEYKVLCNTSPRFRDYFLHYFFPKMQVERSVILDREISKDGSRVDFIIHNKNETYIIENKINDKNHHFGVGFTTKKIGPKNYVALYMTEQYQLVN